MPASLTSLPAEILTQISTNLPKSGQRVDLALCSRTLYNIIHPTIYTNITLLSRRHLPALLTHLLANPTLADRVVALTLTKAWNPPWTIEGSPPIDMTPHDIATASERINSSTTLSAQEKTEWTEALNTNDQDPYLALLLSSLPSLKHLDMTVAEAPGDCVVKLLKSASKHEKLFKDQSLPAFQHLRVLTANCSEYNYGASIDSIHHYLALPALRALHLQGIHSDDDDVGDNTAGLSPPPNHPLEHLEFRQARFCPEDLQHILAVCPHLKTFIYEEGWSHASTNSWSTPGLREALAACEGGLESLWIDYEEDADFEAEDQLAPMRDLAKFGKLKHLRVGMFVLFGACEQDDGGDEEEMTMLARVLPPSLEMLYIGYPERPMALAKSPGTDVLLDALDALLSRKCEYGEMPCLRRVVLEMDKEGESTELEKKAREAGVEIVRIDSALSTDERRNLGFEGGEGRMPLAISQPSYVPRRTYGEGGCVP